MKNTRAVFGDYVKHLTSRMRWTALDATVPIFYESRLAKSWTSTRPEMEQLNADVEEVFEDEEDAALKKR
ncbi:MAG: hypothetical protein IPH39_18140 [Sulfuritalea sp.]|nr:hypothetical protein [Sulfuritalea sp.]